MFAAFGKSLGFGLGAVGVINGTHAAMQPNLSKTKRAGHAFTAVLHAALITYLATSSTK